MKRMVMIIIASMLVLTGCKENALTEYVEAHNRTMEIKRGNLTIDIKAEIEYNEEGLEEEELIKLSYYDKIEVLIDQSYNDLDEVRSFIMKYYMNLGGMGFDFTLYKDEEDIYVKLPILNTYMRVEDMSTGFADRGDEKDYSEYEEIFIEIGNEWNEVLEEENVVKGNKAYMTTSEGQVKATSYTIVVNEDQMERFLDILKDNLEGEDSFILKVLEGQGMDDDEKEAVVKDVEMAIDKMALGGFNGLAYVDFNGRLIKETFNINIGFRDADKGEPKSLDLEYTITHNNLGEAIELDFPTIDDDMWLQEGELEQFSKTFPVTN